MPQESIAYGDNLRSHDFSFPPMSNNNIYFKEIGEKGKKFNKNKKPLIERPGDWICSGCQNLNFAFRTNCNRCHLPKEGNQRFFGKIKQY